MPVAMQAQICLCTDNKMTIIFEFEDLFSKFKKL